MAKKNRIFISFAIDDERYRDFLVGQARNEKSPFVFVDMSVKQPWDNPWKTNCRTKAGVKAKDVIEEEAIDLLAERLTTPLEIESNLTRALESAYLIGEKPVSTWVIDSVVPAPVSDLEATLMCSGYGPKDLAALLTAKPKEIKLLLRGELEAARTDELRAHLRTAGLPVPDLGEANEVSEEHKEDTKKETKR